MATEAVPERQQTDESLESEREKTDEALAEKIAVEHVADDVIERTREETDAATAESRAEVDEILSGKGRPSSLMRVRAYEDRVLGNNRDEVDEAMRDERATSARLARLIPLERERTDQHLEIERARFDEAVANRDDFLGMVSHDLRGLLSSVIMGADRIAMDHPDHERTKVSTQRIHRAATRMARLISDLVDVASIDAGKLSVYLTVADAESVVREAIDTWAATASAKEISLTSTKAQGVRAKFDHERILQVLGNLIANAVKFSDPGDAITVQVDAIGDEVRFTVRDTGLGIPMENQQAIFERFWHVGTNDRRGLGLGLYISRCLVEAHGGTLQVSSTPGEGSIFSFTVPGAP